MTYTGPVPPLTLKDKLAFYRARLSERTADFFRKPSGNNSGLGKTVQLAGVLSVLYALFCVYPPAAFLVGGLAALVAGERI